MSGGPSTVRRPNGGYVTRAELGAELERIGDHLGEIRESIARLEQRVGAWGHWFRDRLTRLVDGLLGKAGIAVAVAAATYFLSH